MKVLSGRGGHRSKLGRKKVGKEVSSTCMRVKKKFGTGVTGGMAKKNYQGNRLDQRTLTQAGVAPEKNKGRQLQDKGPQ